MRNISSKSLFFHETLIPQVSKTSLPLWIWRTRTQFYRDDSLQNRGHDVRTSHTSTGGWGCVSVTVFMNDISQITVKYSSYRWVEFPYRVQQRDDAIYGSLELLIGERPCPPVCVRVASVGSGKALVHFLKVDLFLIHWACIKQILQWFCEFSKCHEFESVHHQPQELFCNSSVSNSITACWFMGLQQSVLCSLQNNQGIFVRVHLIWHNYFIFNGLQCHKIDNTWVTD